MPLLFLCRSIRDWLEWWWFKVMNGTQNTVPIRRYNNLILVGSSLYLLCNPGRQPSMTCHVAEEEGGLPEEVEEAVDDQYLQQNYVAGGQSDSH